MNTLHVITSFITKICFNVNHQFFDFLTLIYMRDRLRCHRCRAVGTWKPHGGWLHRDKLSRRRLCKYCGYFINASKISLCRPSKTRKVWSHTGSMKRPIELCDPLDPWRG